MRCIVCVVTFVCSKPVELHTGQHCDTGRTSDLSKISPGITIFTVTIPQQRGEGIERYSRELFITVLCIYYLIIYLLAADLKI